MEDAEPRSVVHAIFSLERLYDASPALVFRALSDPAAKARWFEGGGGWTVIERTMDVRPGGRERVKGRWPNGRVTMFDAVYFDVVPDRRLVYCYEMRQDARKISVSLATIELAPAGAGTRLKVTEQGAFLDGYDDAGSREHGTGALLDRLGASLRT
ncbi:MAG: SRPBCC family protein [Xanthobacteraceae bacterium]|nr:SRPBCC family protein [Xanthobacteraceae bacterium]